MDLVGVEEDRVAGPPAGVPFDEADGGDTVGVTADDAPPAGCKAGSPPSDTRVACHHVVSKVPKTARYGVIQAGARRDGDRPKALKARARTALDGTSVTAR